MQATFGGDGLRRAGSPRLPRDGGSEDVVLSMQARLADQASEKEALQLELHGLRRAAEQQRRALLGVAEDATATPARIRESIRMMDLELREKLRGEVSLNGPPSPGRGNTFAILRQSLHETQRRSDALYTEMMRASDENDQLLHTLNNIKDANRRLLEQIRQQTDEIDQVTQRRVEDEEFAETRERQHRTDLGMAQQEADRKLHAMQREFQDKYDTAYSFLSQKLRHCSARTEVVREKAIDTQMLSVELKREVSSRCEDMHRVFEAAKHNLLNHCGAELRKHDMEKSQLNDYIQDLERKLAQEKEERHKEILQVGQQHAQITMEREHVRQLRDSETSRLSAQADALERALQADLQAYEQERVEAREVVGDLARQNARIEQQLDEKKREQVRLESLAQSLEADKKTANSKVAELRRSLRESDDALAMAVNSNEHFKAQIEEQRQRYVEMNNREQGQLRSEFEDQCMGLRDQSNSEMGHLQQQIREVSADLHQKNNELDRLLTTNKGLEQDLLHNNKDLAMWKSQYNAAIHQKQEVEIEASNLKSELARDKFGFQERNKHLEVKNTELEQDLQVTSQQFAELKKETVIRDSELSSQVATMTKGLREAESDNGDARKRLTDAADALRRVQQDAQTQHQRTLEAKASLERALGGKLAEAAGEKRRLETSVEEARKEATEVQGHLDQLRSSTSQAGSPYRGSPYRATPQHR